MRSIALLLLCAAALGACARYVPNAPSDQRVTAGVESRFELPKPPPEDAELTWDPGDGTKPVQGKTLVHAWQAPGTYKVTVEAPGGKDSFEVEVVSRPVLAVVPAGVSSAVAVPAAWTELPRIIDLVRRIAPRSDLEAQLDRLEKALGFDPTDPKALAGAGIDPGEGLALVTLPEDPEGTWLLLGIQDEDKALALARKILGADEGTEVATEKGRLLLGTDEAGAAVAWGVTGGYLTARLPGSEGGDLEAAFARLALAPAGTLANYAPYQKAKAMAPGDDAVFFADVPGQTPEESITAAGGIQLEEDAFTVSAGVPLAKDRAVRAKRALQGRKARPDFLARIPQGAVGFGAVSVQLSEVLQLLVAEPLQRALVEGMISGRTGLPLSSLLDATTGNLAGAVWFDADSFMESALQAMRGEEATWEPPPAMVLVELSGAGAADTVNKALVGAGARREGGKLTKGELVFDTEPGFLVISTKKAGKLLGGPRGATDLQAAIPQKLLSDSGEEIVFLDVKPIAEGLRGATMPKGLKPDEAAFLEAMVMGRLEVLDPLDDVFLHARAIDQGLVAQVRVRLKEAK